ncbi:hypothetical protein GCM10008933_37570 [Paenibacillus motobuensis]|uniref:Uncharacterized protein n=1 Tax=Paenibacillus motobuensis TaxID=295324 RepID=A0ABN0YPG6_9BACL
MIDTASARTTLAGLYSGCFVRSGWNKNNAQTKKIMTEKELLRK